MECTGLSQQIGYSGIKTLLKCANTNFYELFFSYFREAYQSAITVNLMLTFLVLPTIPRSSAFLLCTRTGMLINLLDRENISKGAL